MNIEMEREQVHERDSQGESEIGEMAVQFGVSLRALRFYEDRKLLSPRRAGKQRIYGPDDRVRLRMILDGKQFGFTLTEIGEMINAKDSSGDLEHKLQPEQVENQIVHLQRQRQEIDLAIAKLHATQVRLNVPNSERQILS